MARLRHLSGIKDKELFGQQPVHCRMKTHNKLHSMGLARPIGLTSSEFIFCLDLTR